MEREKRHETRAVCFYGDGIPAKHGVSDERLCVWNLNAMGREVGEWAAVYLT